MSANATVGHTVSPVRALIWIYLPTSLILLVVVVIQQVSGLPFPWFTKDPAAITGQFPLLGVLSTLGILGWTIGASVALFAAMLLPAPDPHRSLLLGFSGLTLLLGFDDAFLIHEEIAPRFLRIPEEGLMAGYAGLALFLLFVHKDTIWATAWWLLGAAGIFLATSILIDFLFAYGATQTSVEDTFKFIGIASWTGWMVLTSFQAVQAQQAGHHESVPTDVRDPVSA